MSEQSASAKSPELFARKGSARPAGTLIHYERAVALRNARRAQDAGDTGDSKAGADAAESGADQNELDLKGSQAGKSRSRKGKGGKLDSVADPAGSLLAIPFRRLDQQARGVPAEDLQTGVPEADSPPKVPLKKRDAKPLLPPAPVADEPGTPVPARPTPQVAATPAPGAGRESWAAAGLGVLAMIGVALGLWYTMQGSRPTGEANPAPAESAPTAPAAAPGEELATAAEPGGPASQSPVAEAASESAADKMEPSFDLIRIEPDGQAVIAGRAAPDTELILLDNGKPIGTVTADWSGEWAFIPDQPLEAGDHKFSLVVSTPQGTVTIPAPAPAGEMKGGGDLENAVDGLKGGGASKAAPDRQSHLDAPSASDDAAPLAASAKTGASPGEPSYDVQLSSTTTRKGAQEELTKLQRSFPALLGDKVLFVQEAKIDETDTRYRIRTGPFADLDPARRLCAEFRSLKQDCLVIER